VIDGPQSIVPAARRDRRWLWLLLALWFVASALLIWQKWRGIELLSLPDTDDNMRLQQVRDWLGGQGWFDLRQHRMAPPLGADIHWSRLVDLPLAGLIVAAGQFVSQPVAERFAVAVAPLLPLLVAMVALAMIVRRTVGERLWALGPVLLLCGHSTIGMMSPLRIDHHGWQIALTLVMAMGLLMRRSARGGAIAGVAFGLSLAIGVETLPYLAVGATVAAAGWILNAREAPRLAGFAVAAMVTASLAFLIFIPPAGRVTAWCDALSPVYFQAVMAGGVGALLLTLRPIERRWLRLALALALGALVVGLVLATHPTCILDPYSAVNAEARRDWLENVREARPIYQHSALVQVSILSLPLAGLLGAFLTMWRQRRDPDALWRWSVMAAFALFATLLTLSQTRAGIMAQALSVPGAAALLWLVVSWIRQRAGLVVRVAGTVGAFTIVSGIGFEYVVSKVPHAKSSPTSIKARRVDAICNRPAALHPFDRYPAGTIWTFVDLGPRFVTQTHHSVLAGPYHRNGAMIVDMMHGWTGTADNARDFVRRHGIRYVAICPGSSESTIYAARGKNGFYRQLAAGRVPDWLSPLPLPGRSPYRLWRVADKGM
jgi:hypothetical protein